MIDLYRKTAFSTPGLAGLERYIAMRRKYRRSKAEWASERARLEELTQQARRETEQLRTALAEAERAMDGRATSPTPTEPGEATDP